MHPEYLVELDLESLAQQQIALSNNNKRMPTFVQWYLHLDAQCQ